jgi:hypothetical protein
MPTCTKAAFIAGTACYRNFSAQERASIQIYFNALELEAIGGTDYRDGLGSGGTLENAAICYRDFVDNIFQAPTPYALLVAYNNAVAAGASPADTVSALATAIACNKNFPEADLAAQQLQLLCELGQHATQ